MACKFSKCKSKIIGLIKVGKNQRVPNNGKGYTGSDRYCRRHQVFEPWWPFCILCKSKRVAWEARGDTDGYCYICVKNKSHIKEELDLTDPILNDSKDGLWATVVKKSYKTYTVAHKPKEAADLTLVSEAVAEAQRIAEMRRLEAEAAERELQKIIADEKKRLEEETTRKKDMEESALRDRFAKLFQKEFTIQEIRMLLDFIDKTF